MCVFVSGGGYVSKAGFYSNAAVFVLVLRNIEKHLCAL